MKHWGAPSPKRQFAITNSAIAKKFDKGRLVRDRSEGPSKNAKKYIDRAGKQRYTGTRLLKATQCATQSIISSSCMKTIQPPNTRYAKYILGVVTIWEGNKVSYEGRGFITCPMQNSSANLMTIIVHSQDVSCALCGSDGATSS